MSILFVLIRCGRMKDWHRDWYRTYLVGVPKSHRRGVILPYNTQLAVRSNKDDAKFIFLRERQRNDKRQRGVVEPGGQTSFYHSFGFFSAHCSLTPFSIFLETDLLLYPPGWVNLLEQEPRHHIGRRRRHSHQLGSKFMNQEYFRVYVRFWVAFRWVPQCCVFCYVFVSFPACFAVYFGVNAAKDKALIWPLWNCALLSSVRYSQDKNTNKSGSIVIVVRVLYSDSAIRSRKEANNNNIYFFRLKSSIFLIDLKVYRYFKYIGQHMESDRLNQPLWSRS